MVHQTRESKEAQARNHLAALEDLRLRSTTELRDFGRELAAAGEELEKSREAARCHEGRACKLQASKAPHGIMRLEREGFECTRRSCTCSLCYGR